jgi:hypothetical protein
MVAAAPPQIFRGDSMAEWWMKRQRVPYGQVPELAKVRQTCMTWGEGGGDETRGEGRGFEVLH